MLGCGHVANATNTKKGTPSCIICVGIDPKAETVVEAPDLTGRFMRCGYDRGDGCPKTRHGGGCCTEPKPSSLKAAFFEYVPTAEVDMFYCGCWGFD